MREELGKKEGETNFEHKKRLCLAKLNKELKIEWEELVEVLGLDCSADHLRKLSYAYKEEYEYQLERNLSHSEKKKVLIMNDIHLPFQREDVLEEIRKHKNIDYLLIAGDLIDCESCSSFDVENRPSVEEELTIAYKFIEKINTIIDPTKTKIIAIDGNHEERYRKTIIRMQQKQLSKMLNPNLLQMIQEGYSYYDKGKKFTFKPIENFEYINSWKVKLFNNLIICHPKDFSQVDGRVCEKVSAHFLNRGMADVDDLIVFGHTHKHSAMNVNRRQGVYVIENFCMCKPHDYADCGKLNYTPQNYGYTYLEFEEGKKIDINDIKIVHLK
jgi:predicted phosphodiesterase